MRLPLLMSLIFVVNNNFFRQIFQISFVIFIFSSTLNVHTMNAKGLPTETKNYTTPIINALDSLSSDAVSLSLSSEIEAIKTLSDKTITDLMEQSVLKNRTPALSKTEAINASSELKSLDSSDGAKVPFVLNSVNITNISKISSTIAVQKTDDLNDLYGENKMKSLHMSLPVEMELLNRTKEYSSLSSLSLFSANETGPPVSSSASGSSSGGAATNLKHPRASNDKLHFNHNSTTGTFQQIGMQHIILKTTMPTSSANSYSNSLNNRSSSSSSSGNSNSNNGKSVIRTSAKKVESKFILPKVQKTDAPMLNYIFDTYSSANKHHHHDQRYGPHFEDVQRLGQPTNLTVQAGSSIHLNCKISLLQDKTVSWVRRNAQGENALDLLTVGRNTYTGDKRYQIEFQYPNNWRLKITNVKKDDEAMYECQISTHPPRVIQINLHVNAPKVMIIDEFGDPLQEKYYEIDSTLQLSCVVRNVAMSTSVVFWKHGEDVLNYDVTRGGVSVKTELMDDGANSTLFIAKINKADSGNYTCSISEFQNFTVVVHILNGESFAELHHGSAGTPYIKSIQQHFLLNFLILILILCVPPTFITR